MKKKFFKTVIYPPQRKQQKLLWQVAATGFEPVNIAFGELCLTYWRNGYISGKAPLILKWQHINYQKELRRTHDVKSFFWFIRSINITHRYGYIDLSCLVGKAKYENPNIF